MVCFRDPWLIFICCIFTVSEEITCTSKHLHSCTMSEQQLATAAASTNKVSPPPEISSETAMKSEPEILSESDRNICKSFFKKKLTFYPNVSDEVRWNQSPTHTYDSSFMLPDASYDTLRMSKGNSKLIVGDKFDRLHGTSLPVEILSNEMKSLNGEKESSSDKSLISNKKSFKASKKVKKVAVKKVKTGVNKVKLNPVISEKNVPLTSKKKTFKVQSKQKLSDRDELDVLELSQNSATELHPSAKTKKIVKTFKLMKEDDKYFREVRKQGRETSFNQTLASYIGVCVSGLTLMFDERKTCYSCMFVFVCVKYYMINILKLAFRSTWGC